MIVGLVGIGTASLILRDAVLFYMAKLTLKYC